MAAGQKGIICILDSIAVVQLARYMYIIHDSYAWLQTSSLTQSGLRRLQSMQHS